MKSEDIARYYSPKTRMPISRLIYGCASAIRFRRLRDRFRAHEWSIFEIAACLAPDSSRPLTPIALSMLAEEVERQVNGTRETTPI